MGKTTSDESMKPYEFENVPTEGFVLNKKAGGYSTGWNHRSTYCRVYDPRGFEIEISIPNLLFILQECNAYKGKGLEGSFVYSWDGKDLVLLPTSSLDYQESKKFTKLQEGKISTKDLLEGCVYKDKEMREWVYIGRFQILKDNYSSIKPIITHVFALFNRKSYYEFEPFDSMSSFVQRVSETPVSNYAELLEKFNNSKFSGKLDKCKVKQLQLPQRYDYQDKYYGMVEVRQNEYQQYTIEFADKRFRYGNNFNLMTNKKLIISDNGNFVIKKMPTQRLENLTYNDVKKYNFKVLKYNNYGKTSNNNIVI